MAISWKGYEFHQDKDIMKLYCKYKNFSLLDFKTCLGYGKKLFDNYYFFVKINFPQCSDSQLSTVLHNILKGSFSIRVLSTKHITGLTTPEIGHTMVIDLTKSENELWRSLKKKKRNAIHQGYRRGVKVSLLEDEGKLEEWISVYINTAKRKKFSRLPESLVRDLFKLKNTFFFASIINNEIASVALIVEENNHIYWWIGGTNLKYQKYRPNDVLHWEIIKWGLEVGFEYYDMVGLVLGGNHGPTKFKLGYNGEIVSYYVYKINKYIIGKIINNMI